MTTVTLTSLPANAAVFVVERTHAAEVLADYPPDPHCPAAITARPPSELGPILATVTANSEGRAVITGLSRDQSSGGGVPTRRYYALAQLPDGTWRRVSFAVSGQGASADVASSSA